MTRRLSADEILEIIAQVAELAGIDSDSVDPDSIDKQRTFAEAILQHVADQDCEKIDLEKREKRRSAERAIRAANEAILALDKEDQARLARATREVFPGIVEALHRTTVDGMDPARFSTAAIFCYIEERLIWIWADNLLLKLSEMTGSNPDSLPPAGNGRGRRKHTVANWHMQAFVAYVWQIAKAHGGNFYADRKGKGGGTMIRALRLLAPLLPSGFVPNVLPQRTIEKTIKKERASVASLEKLIREHNEGAANQRS